jgi:hypothetical protein
MSSVAANFSRKAQEACRQVAQKRPEKMGCVPKLQDRQAVARAMRALMLLRSIAHRQKQDRGTQP